MISKDYMKDAAAQYGFELDEKILSQLDRYAEYLVEWNEKINLTTIIEPDEICLKHFLDSILLLDAAGGEIPEGASVIDVGTGAGFPSVPCRLLRDDISLTLLDSLNKRVKFLEGLSEELEIADTCECIHGRAEELGQDPDLRESFDFATARAVAHLRELAEYCLPFVKQGGYFAALKGYEIEDEIDEAKKAIYLMGGKIKKVKKYVLPGDNKRAIILIKKISRTPPKYPRISAKMKKQPIR